MENRDGPFEGVPDWMFGPLWQWFTDRFPVVDQYGTRAPLDDYRNLASALRISLESTSEPNPSSPNGHRQRLFALAKASPDVLLECADYWLFDADLKTNGLEKYEGEALGELLARAGSVYRVDPGASRDARPPRRRRDSSSRSRTLCAGPSR